MSEWEEYEGGAWWDGREWWFDRDPDETTWNVLVLARAGARLSSG